MDELIKIETTNHGTRIVNAREFYDRIGLAPQHWKKWYMKNIVENDFAIEYTDYWELPPSGRTREFMLSMDFAKKLAMVQRTEHGEKVRQYFIACEKVAFAATKPLSQLEILAQSVQTLIEQDKRINSIEQQVKQLEAKVLTSPTDYFTIAGYALLQGMKIDVPTASKIGRKVSSICTANGYPTGTVPDARFGKVKTYPKEALEAVFNELS